MIVHYDSLKKCHYIASSHSWVQCPTNNGHRQYHKQDTAICWPKIQRIISCSLTEGNYFNS